jgi:serine/threonine-protein kinase
MAIDLTWLQQQFPEILSLSPLSEGGQKEVFSGAHATDGAVVLKIYHPQTDLSRVVREIQAVQGVGSPRVPKIFEVGTKNTHIGDVVWVREEQISGENLRQVLRKKGTLSLQQVLKLGRQILEALADAENVRIVHRDVKPANIIVDCSGDAWLLDFGLARHLDLTSLTATSDYYGPCTPGYAPPEQFRNRKSEIDARADLFALGVTLYECSEGVNPFVDRARDILEILRRVESCPLPAISGTVDNKGKFPQLVTAMTRQRPNHRLSSIQEALTWMQEICAEEGIN